MAIGNATYSDIPLRRGDVVDNLVSTVTDLPLSAAQGKLLADRMGRSDIAAHWIGSADIKEYALALPVSSITYICTSADTQGLPPGDYRYSAGLVLRRAGGVNILLFHWSRPEIMMTTYINPGWSGWGKLLTGTPSSISYGVLLTNEIPPRTETKANQLVLNPGKYIITGQTEYTTSFNNSANVTIRISTKGTACINRGTGNAGGGQSPTAIIDLHETTTMYLAVYQDSADVRILSRNHLTAVKIG